MTSVCGMLYPVHIHGCLKLCEVPEQQGSQNYSQVNMPRALGTADDRDPASPYIYIRI